jgi:hypothetical protein
MSLPFPRFSRDLGGDNLPRQLPNNPFGIQGSLRLLCSPGIPSG